MSGPAFSHHGGVIGNLVGLSSVMTTVQLPMDAEEHIIDQLVDDISSLRNCALTCRAWHPRSWYHLLLSIQIRTRDDYESVCEYFSRHQSLSLLVEILTISPSNEEPHPRSLVEVALVGLLRRLPQLRRYKVLHIDNSALPLHYTTFHPRALIHFKAYLHAEALQLGPLRLSSHAELGRLVAALPRLRSLECRDLAFGRLNSSSMSPRFANQTCLLDVSFKNMDPEATKFVLGLSSILQSISLELDGTRDLPSIDFAKLPDLQALQLSLINMANEIEGVGEAAHFLTNNLPLGLRKLTIILPFVRFGYVDVDDLNKSIPPQCREFEDVLRPAPLESVTFMLSNIPSNRVQCWKRLFEHVLPDLQGRGLLKVECPLGRTKYGHNDYVTSLQVSPNHSWVASTSADGTIVAWSVDGKGILQDTQLPGDNLPFALPCGDCFVSSLYSSYSGYITAVWDVKGRKYAQGHEIPMLFPHTTAQRHDHTFITLSASTTSYGSAVRIYESPKDIGKRPYPLHEVNDLPIGPSNTKFVMTSHDDTFLVVACNLFQNSRCLLWRKQLGEYICEDVFIGGDFPGSTFTTGAFSPVSFSPYQHTYTLPPRTPDSIVRSYGSCLAIGFADGHVKMVSLCLKRGRRNIYAEHADYGDFDRPVARHDGHVLDLQQRSLYRHDGSVTCLAFSPRGTFFLSASEDSTLKVLARNSSPQRAPVTLRGHVGKVHAACFSSNERYIASASEDRTVRVWRVEDWSCLATFSEHEAAVTHVVFCPGGGAVWSAARDGRVCRHGFAPYIRKDRA